MDAVSNHKWGPDSSPQALHCLLNQQHLILLVNELSQLLFLSPFEFLYCVNAVVSHQRRESLLVDAKFLRDSRCLPVFFDLESVNLFLIPKILDGVKWPGHQESSVRFSQALAMSEVIVQMNLNLFPISFSNLLQNIRIIFDWQQSRDSIHAHWLNDIQEFAISSLLL